MTAGLERVVLSTAADAITCRGRLPLKAGGGPCGALNPLPDDGSPPIQRCQRCGQGLPWCIPTGKASRGPVR